MKASGSHDGTALSIRGRAARNNRLMGVGGATLAVTMIGLTYAAAPFYSAFCRATGYEGTPQQVKANTDAEGHRILRVGFDANVAPGLDWSFEPEVESIRLRTGQTAKRPAAQASTTSARSIRCWAFAAGISTPCVPVRPRAAQMSK